ncbi:2-oxo acid dehydrogenase subunit E2 [Spiroplasma tabanidicola]|uniref:Pyruvate dehydrogenase E2 component n=1 Tax=Spiroplasma tabanidicola TaxID=324079 RepID=A0A6I6CJQ5_9MOLU|nr:2-oxo acid dehydrogenase subunit E2 [Spiroplasma tabanidicola]QGS52323.1 pyruvate dehydrogenase E2 component [Spiroplasma tabanidicola]
MVHLRARNLPQKGILTEWLFTGEDISFGDDFALIKLDDKSTVTIKSNYNGVVVKTIKIGSPVKNGSILANIAIGEKEIAKFKNRFTNPGNVENTVVKGIYIPDEVQVEKLQPVESDADQFSGAVVYNRYNQAITPFSSGEDDIVDSVEKYKKLEERDVKMTQSNNSASDRFAQMRANIQNSIKNSPQKKVLGDLSSEELLKIDNQEMIKSGGNIFEKQDGVGPSKFRQMIQARKEKLLQEHNYKEVNTEQHVDAMSKLDENGRPLIMRNIIASRIEKLNKGGGDPSVLERDIVATKENAIMDKDRQKPQEVSQMPKQPIQQQSWAERGSKNLEVRNDDVFMRAKASEDGDFGTSFGAYVYDSEATLIDANDLNPYGGFVMPQKKPEQLINEIDNKQQKTYAESKLSNLYDVNKRWNLMKNRDERSTILSRRRAVEQGLDESIPKYVQYLQEGKIPQQFLQPVTITDPNTGQSMQVPYGESPAGKREFESWLRASNLYTSYLEVKNDQQNGVVYSNTKQQAHENFEHQKNWFSANEFYKPEQNTTMTVTQEVPDTTPKKVQKQIKKQLDEVGGEYINLAGNQANETITYLQKQINDLQTALIQQNQLNQATQRVNTVSSLNGGTDTFSQLMQYILMQNLIQNIPLGSGKVSNDDIKGIIKREIDDFKYDLKRASDPNYQNHFYNQPNQFYPQQNPQPNQFYPQQNPQQNHFYNQPNQFYPQQNPQPNQFYPQQNYPNQQQFDENLTNQMNQQNKNYDDMQTVNFEKNSNEESIGYMEFEGEDENKMVTREKVNENRNQAVKSMILSQNYIPPLTISTEVDMSSILKLKHLLKTTHNSIKFSTISFIVKSISVALEEHPKLNSSYDPETNEVVIKQYHNIGLATETSEGLIIPVLKFVEKMSIKDVAIDIKEITQRLRAGELYNYEVEGSTITIANYGNIGAIQATPTIFYPNAAVVGVGKVVKKPVVVSNEKLAIKAMMNISLTIDQRIIDAAEAGKFLAKVKEILERPEILTVT